MQLKHFLEVQQVPLYEFAVKIGVSPDTVYAWCQGRKFPRRKNIHIIFEATKGAVSLHDWNDLRNNA